MHTGVYITLAHVVFHSLPWPFVASRSSPLLCILGSIGQRVPSPHVGYCRLCHLPLPAAACHCLPSPPVSSRCLMLLPVASHRLSSLAVAFVAPCRLRRLPLPPSTIHGFPSAVTLSPSRRLPSPLLASRHLLLLHRLLSLAVASCCLPSPPLASATLVASHSLPSPLVASRACSLCRLSLPPVAWRLPPSPPLCLCCLPSPLVNSHRLVASVESRC